MRLAGSFSDRRLRRSERPPAIGAWALALLAVGAGSCGPMLPGAPGAVLFQDDFSRPSTGWETYDETDFSAAYADGALRLQVHTPYSLAWSTPHFDLGDVRLEVDTTAAGGPTDNAFGLVCRYRDAGNYTFFLVSSDGFSGIGTVRDGQRSLLTGVAMLPSDFILQGLTSNHLRADCSGPQLRLYINGAVAQEATTEGVSTGDVGVIVGSYGTPGVEVLFDNFTVSNP